MRGDGADTDIASGFPNAVTLEDGVDRECLDCRPGISVGEVEL